MEDLEKTLTPNPSSEVDSSETRALDTTAVKTAPLPRYDPGPFKNPAEKKEEDFRLGQSLVLQRIAANAPSLT